MSGATLCSNYKGILVKGRTIEAATDLLIAKDKGRHIGNAEDK